MGRFSDLAIQQNEGPQLTFLEKTICEKCVKDIFLAKIVRQNVISVHCSYCDRKYRTNKAAPYDIIMQHVYDAVLKYYGDAQDINLPYTEGEWLLGSTLIEDVLSDFDPGWPDEFTCDLASSADPFWHLVEHVNSNWLQISEHDALLYSWDTFKKQILYKTRYLFLSEPTDELEDRQIIPVRFMLDALANECKGLKLIKKIPKDSEFYRIRSHGEEDEFTEFSEVGVAPKRNASSGRMNPAGIPYFYIASTSDTAKAETISDQRCWTLATFKLKEDISVIDFSKLSKIPSKFETRKYKLRQKLLFIHSFVKDISTPVEKDGMEHIDYIPTQVVSEFFRYRFSPKVKGIKYKSIKDPKGINIAVFESDNADLQVIFDLVSTEKFTV
ncbi:HEPN-associated N-terminal domain-containing protein [Acinetobacter sp. MYb177]|uniref:HEPN-associated N-terminal domain-containing protein n=1 Tax=unclassified Acinetobacter TaxID=196816 RepID=UPI0030A37852